MSNNRIVIPRKAHARGEDGYRNITVRMREDTIAALNELAKESKYSRNELINIILEYGVENIDIVE